MYREWAERRLNEVGDVIVYTSSKNGDFGFRCMNYYTGLMAQPSRTGKNKGNVRRPKQGLFDICVLTGTRYKTGVSHRMILEDVLKYTTYEKCISVWRGISPKLVGESENEKEVLYTLALLFFEQEINWGNEEWQRYTYFAPKVRTPQFIRPRDMLMGYIAQAYDLGIDDIAYWQNARPTTTTFIAPDGSNYGYEDYAERYKQYFTNLQNDYAASALMVGDIRIEYKRIAKNTDNNPYFKN